MIQYIKKIAKKILIEYRIMKGFYYDYRKYSQSSLKTYKSDLDFDESLGLIIRLYHSLEKSLTNKKFKKESSIKNVSILIDIFINDKNIDYDNVHVQSALNTISLYFDKHAEKGSSELEQMREKYKTVILKVGAISSTLGGVKPIPKITETNNLIHDGYKAFVCSRVSIRDFSEKIPTEVELESVVDVARFCPSACNRQAIKIFYSLDIKNNGEILKLQNGSRSFRNNVPGLIILAADLRYQEGVEERNLGLIEGGIWISSLVNSFHANNMGSCVLNWCVNPVQDRMLRSLINIPNHYQIVSLLAFGYIKSEQLVPFSTRKNAISFLDKIKFGTSD